MCVPGLGAEITPQSKIDLLADSSLADFHFHLSEKNSVSTERAEVAVIDNGVLHVTGKGFGYFRTKEAYRDYHLVAEFRWGEKTWANRKDRARDCGLLMHCHGPDGASGGTWPACVQAQMLEGSTGDLNVLQGKEKDGALVPTRVTAQVREGENGGLYWAKGGESRPLPPEGKAVQSIRWNDRDPGWKDEKGFRGKNDVERPVGQWNRLEVICDGGSIQILLNGVLVNEASNVKPSSGFIGVQNEWAECFFRRLELWPLGKAPKGATNP